ncbi:MAG: MarR family transcriptional regulator [Hyphomicrobiales bacterium]|nr:MAG: MarR family transcriptional regulator [Hyphomicrobiales bacterium]
MTTADQKRDLAFTLSDVARLFRTCADQKVAQFGVTRAKWAVLARLERSEGLKQSELAEMLDLQAITLTRLLDGLSESGLIERRADVEDRRAKRLYLTPAARPLLKRLGKAGNELMEEAFEGLSDAETARLLSSLLAIKDNLRRAAHRKDSEAEVRYG